MSSAPDPDEQVLEIFRDYSIRMDPKDPVFAIFEAFLKCVELRREVGDEDEDRGRTIMQMRAALESVNQGVQGILAEDGALEKMAQMLVENAEANVENISENVENRLAGAFREAFENFTPIVIDRDGTVLNAAPGQAAVQEEGDEGPAEAGGEGAERGGRGHLGRIISRVVMNSIQDDGLTVTVPKLWRWIIVLCFLALSLSLVMQAALVWRVVGQG